VNRLYIKWLAFPAVLLAAGAALAQDFTAGKTPAQLFGSDCSACHRLPNGLGKKYDVASLSGFLREHYTTKPDSAGALAKYVMGFANLRAMPTTAPSAGDTVAAKPAEEPKARRRTSNLSGDGVKRLRSPVASEPPAAAIEAVVEPTAATQKPAPERGSESETSPPVAKLNDYARSGVAVVPKEVVPREGAPPEAAPREADDPIARIRAYATSGVGPEEAAAEAPTPTPGTSRRGSAARGAKPAAAAVVAPAAAPAAAPVAPAASMPPPAPL
jgi:hypothetical protein